MKIEMRRVLPVPFVPIVRQTFLPNTLVTGAILIAALYFGRDVFVPLALAILLSFVLAPMANRLQRLRVGRIPSVLFVVIVAFAAILGVVGYVGTQVAQLATDLPSYESTIQAKITALRGASAAGGTLARAGNVLSNLDSELNRPSANKPGRLQSTPNAAGSDGAKPIPVEVHQPLPSTLETLAGIASPLVHPLVTIGIVIVFLIFILLQREDLRDRLIRLAGSHDLQRTTAAIDDAAKSLSKYFLTQVAVNMAFGIVVGIGLRIIGIPNPLLWGTLGAVLRFVPYVGTLIAAALPISVAAAVDPGWSLALWTAALILGLELLVGQVIEPLVYGHSSGISPLAVVLSAILWTALWGPAGLLMATPLTICLVVLGRHVDHLEFLDVILGDKPPLTPAQNFYQRLLANDPEEAAEQAEKFMIDRSMADYYDEVALKGLELAQSDLSRGSLDGAKVLEMKASVEALVDDLSDHEDAVDPDDSPPIATDAVAALGHPIVVVSDVTRSPPSLTLCVGGRSALDDAASLLLAQLLERNGLGARIVGFDTLSIAGMSRLDPEGVQMICVSYLDSSSPAHLRFIVRRLRRRVPQAKIMAGCWSGDPTAVEELAKSAKADFSATSLQQAIEVCQRSSVDTRPADEASKVA